MSSATCLLNVLPSNKAGRGRTDMPKICSVKECNNYIVAKNFCLKHYKRWKKYGDPLYTVRARDRRSIEYPHEWKTYCGMISRCKDKNLPYYNDYGGRGICVCDRWLGPNGFPHFLEDMGPRPGKILPSGISEYSLDRIDVNGPYSPENCRWATWKEQAENRRRRKTEILFEIKGKRMNLKEACDFYGIKYQTAYARYRSGQSLENVFSIFSMSDSIIKL